MQHARLSRPWVVRKGNGKMYACPDIQTLRAWITEGRLHRDDRISKRGDRWFRLGDSPELASDFGRHDRTPALTFPPLQLRDERPERTEEVSFFQSDFLMLDAHGDPTRDRPRRAAGSGRSRGVERRPALEARRPRDVTEADSMLAGFRARRRVRTAIHVVVGVTLIALVAAYSWAMLGPPPNPLRDFAESRGLLPGRRAADAAAQERITLAREAYGRGDLADLTSADLLYARATELGADSILNADRALVLAAKADALGKIARDAVREAEGLSRPSAEPLEKISASKRAEADAVLKLAELQLESAERLNPTHPAVERVRLEILRLEGDFEALSPWLLKAERDLERNKTESDPWTLTVVAAAIVPDPDTASSASLKRAQGYLDRALTLDPKLDRARILWARVRDARGEGADAEKALTELLDRLPAHEEAQRLLAKMRAANKARMAATAATG